MDDETKLTLHGLQQHYVKLQDREKNRKLFDLLDVLEFNQASIQSFAVSVLTPFLHFAGHHLREVCPALHCTCSASGGAELPCHLHPQGNATGREVMVGIN